MHRPTAPEFFHLSDRISESLYRRCSRQLVQILPLPNDAAVTPATPVIPATPATPGTPASDFHIDVIIPTMGTRRSLRNCLDSIAAQSVNLEHVRVIVALNGAAVGVVSNTDDVSGVDVSGADVSGVDAAGTDDVGGMDVVNNVDEVSGAEVSETDASATDDVGGMGVVSNVDSKTDSVSGAAADWVSSVVAAYPQLTVTLLRSPWPGAARARNLGLDYALAGRVGSDHWITFLDDDDEIEPGFLATLLNLSPRADVVASRIRNSGEPAPEKATLQVGPYWAQAREVGVVTARLLRAEYLAQLRFDEDLRSGEDVVFACALLARHPGLRLAVVDAPGCSYLRGLSDQSITRGRDDFEFAVLGRFAVVEALLDLKLGLRGRWTRFMKIRAQQKMLTHYLAQNPGAIDRLAEATKGYPRARRRLLRRIGRGAVAK